MTVSVPIGTATYAPAADLERLIRQSDESLSAEILVEADERERFPHDGLAVIRDWGFGDLLVPRHIGGRLDSYEQLFAAFRALARRDARFAVYYGTTLLAANPVWLWGDGTQQRWLAAAVRDGACGTFAMSEADHGSDLINCGVRARRDGDRFVVDGSKWLVGNGNRGTFLTLYARTGTQAFSLLLLDKEKLPEGRWRPLDRVPTLGLRGHDLSGIEFSACPVPEQTLLGKEGSGAAKVLKTLQLTRTLIGGFAMGGLDTALRIALRYAQGRELYGAPITKIPVVGGVLVDAYLDLLIGECTAVPVTRAISAAPGRVSLWSSVVKYLVPAICEEAVAGLATVLSARRYLRTEFAYRHFQKIERDLVIAGIFEGTSHVNLASIAAQLPHVNDGRGRDHARDDGLLAHLFALGTEPRTWQPSGAAMRLTNGTDDEITTGWPRHRARALELMAALDATLSAELAAVLDRLDRIRARLLRDVQALAVQHSRRPGAHAFTVARTHALLHAAGSVLLTWIHARDTLSPQFRDGEWVVLCLDRIVRRLRTDLARNERLMPVAFDLMCRQAEAGELFSLMPMAIAE
ncbi:acyl-CoA dehydrogenase family protein [Nonomuraea sp. NPDC052265]|uniref:acyl-CoA dehydrogenase family protein n=1 Tax=Nonomuraea sp. NPDC052265 TaxID=3364374 RepID=UPI0037C6735F